MAAKKPKYLNDYEEDLVWMSYRYCIGRHTIAAHMHAGNIAKNVYDKLPENRRNFMAFDIRREIATVLKHTNLWFNSLGRQDDPNYRPLENIIESDNPEKNLEDFDDLYPWMDLANLFDSNSHFEVKIKNENNEIEKIECFYSYIKTVDGYAKVICPITDYLKNPFVKVTLNETQIIK